MGGIVRVLNAGAEHTAAQATVDANRILQAGNNYAATENADTQNKLVASNNKLAQVNADGQTTVRDANNRAELTYNAAKLILQNEGNHDADTIAAAQRVVQSTRNDAVAAKSSLDLWAQSSDNQDKLNAAGKAFNAGQQTIAAQLDQAASGRTWDRLDAAVGLGANVAAAAAAGVGGSTVDGYNETIKRKQAFMEADADAKTSAAVINATKSNADNIGNVRLNLTPQVADLDYSPIIAKHDDNVYVASQDYTPSIANIDYSVYSAKLDYTKYLDAPKMSGFQQIATLALAAGATYFGGPAAGEAVADASLSIYDANNGNMQRAQQEGGMALNGFSTGLKTYRAGANSSNPYGSAWGANIHI